MKTTIYDLLGMIKDNKAPKKIMYKGTTWEYKESEKDYSSVEWNEWLFDIYLITEILNDFIEILETTITYKQDNNIEKVNTYVLCDYDFKHLDVDNNFIATNIINKAFEEYSRKINEIIEVLDER